MSKKNKKLALKKETLRSLSENQLKNVGGGTLLNYAYADVNWYIRRAPTPVSGGCTSIGCAYNFDIAWYF